MYIVLRKRMVRIVCFSITSYGKLKRRHVYYVVAVSNDTEFMGRLLQLVNAQLDINYTSLVIVDMSRKGQDQFNISKYKHQVSSHYIHLGSSAQNSIPHNFNGYMVTNHLVQ